MGTRRHFGHPPHVAVGMEFATRLDLAAAGVHRPLRKGISGSQTEGCDSIVVCAGYEDDEDHWTHILYTGEGGRSHATLRQACDQAMTRGNKALALSCERELPVRVSRGPLPGSPYAPERGYRYEGLYRVARWWTERGRSGYLIYRFRLERLDPRGASAAEDLSS